MPGSWDPNSVYTIDVQYDRNTGKQTGSRWKKFGEHALHYAPLLSLRKPVCLSVHPSRSFLFVYINVCMIFSFSLCLPVSVFFYICLSRLIFQLFFLSFSPISPSPFLPYPSLPTLPPPLPCYHTNINEIQINVMTQQGERGDVGEKKR